MGVSLYIELGGKQPPWERIVVDLFIKVAEQLQKLLKRREEVNRAYYGDFVAPLMADLKTLHENYLSTFAEYRKLLLDASLSFDTTHPILEKIRSDSLFSQDLRATVRVAGPRASSVAFKSAPTETRPQELARAVANYLRCASKDPLTHEFAQSMLGNAARTELDLGISRILQSGMPERMRRQAAVDTLDDIVARIQVNYQNALHAHARAKEYLLTPP